MPYCLISVFDKTGIIDFAKKIIACGYQILSTGGTYKEFHQNNVKAAEISNYTGFDEILDGRIKSLHPFIYAGILARRDNLGDCQKLKKSKIQMVDIVVVNLYPFEKVTSSLDININSSELETKALENIDIGGVSLIRAAAKNFKNVLPITDIQDYERVIQELKNKEFSNELRIYLAKKAFGYVAHYDAVISNFFNERIH